MTVESKGRIDRRLARLEGQIRGVRRMVTEEVYCIDILTQISAIRSAVDQIGAEIATSHVESCIVGHGTESEHDHCKAMTHAELLDELRTTLSRLVK